MIPKGLLLSICVIGPKVWERLPIILSQWKSDFPPHFRAGSPRSTSDRWRRPKHIGTCSMPVHFRTNHTIMNKPASSLVTRRPCIGDQGDTTSMVAFCRDQPCGFSHRKSSKGIGSKREVVAGLKMYLGTVWDKKKLKVPRSVRRFYSRRQEQRHKAMTSTLFGGLT